jgi:hypothetical protein
MWTALRPAHIPTGTKPEAADNSRVTKTGQLNSLSTEIAAKNLPDALHGREFSLNAKRVTRNAPSLI